MKMWQPILSRATKKHESNVTESELEKLFEKECYLILERIKGVLEDDRLEDEDCFERIEDIVRIFEESGICCGARHDFG